MGRVSYGSKQQPDFHPWGRLKVFSAGCCAEVIIEMVMKEFSLCFLPGGGVIFWIAARCKTLWGQMLNPTTHLCLTALMGQEIHQ